MGCKTGLAGAALAGYRAGLAAFSAGLAGASGLGTGVVAGFAVPLPLGGAARPGRPGSAVRPGLPQRAGGPSQPPLAQSVAARVRGQPARSPAARFALGFCGPLSGAGGAGLAHAPPPLLACGGLHPRLEPPFPSRITNQPYNRSSPAPAGEPIRKPAARFGAGGSPHPHRKDAARRSCTGSAGKGCTRPEPATGSS
jgi:hypothetical protein